MTHFPKNMNHAASFLTTSLETATFLASTQPGHKSRQGRLLFIFARIRLCCGSAHKSFVLNRTTSRSAWRGGKSSCAPSCEKVCSHSLSLSAPSFPSLFSLFSLSRSLARSHSQYPGLPSLSPPPLPCTRFRYLPRSALFPKQLESYYCWFRWQPGAIYRPWSGVN